MILKMKAILKFLRVKESAVTIRGTLLANLAAMRLGAGRKSASNIKMSFLYY